MIVNRIIIDYPQVVQGRGLQYAVIIEKIAFGEQSFGYMGFGG